MQHKKYNIDDLFGDVYNVIYKYIIHFDSFKVHSNIVQGIPKYLYITNFSTPNTENDHTSIGTEFNFLFHFAKRNKWPNN